MNKTADYQLTIVIPVHKEEETLYVLEQKIERFLAKSLFPACILFVDDGSNENSLRCVQGICARHPDFFYLSLEKGAVLSAAVKAGIDATESPFLGYMDSEMQTIPDDFNLLLPSALQFELVMGVRINKKDSFFHRFHLNVADGFRRLVTHDGILDAGCPLKVLHTDYAKRIPFFIGMSHFLPAMVLLQGGKVKQVPVHCLSQTGEALPPRTLWNEENDSLLVNCLIFRWMKRRYIHYRVTANNLVP